MTTPFPAANGHVPSADLTHTPAPDGAVQVALARLLAGHSLTSAQLQSLTLPWQLLATALMQQPDREARFAAFESALGARTDYNTLLTTIFAVDLSAPSDKIETFAQTDMGNSRRFAVQHGERLCFVAPWGWLVWDETRWQRDETRHVMRLARQTVRAMLHEAAELEDDGEAKRLAKWAISSQSRNRLEAMISLAGSEPGIPAMPDAFDTHPWLMSIRSGTLDLRTRKQHPHRPTDRMTRVAPVVYDPTATCPTWLAFLERIMRSTPEMLRFLQRAVGYSLTGSTSEQCLFFCFGNGANGKSTFIETLMALVGEYAMKTPTHTLMAKRFEGVPNDVARLNGARVVVAAEVAEGRNLNESLIKDLTGGDRIAARYLHKEFFEFTPTFKVWMYGNHKPIVRGTDGGIWRRIHLIPFVEVIPEGERDPALKDKLRAELPGILNWALQGCLDWQQHGLGVPDTVKLATRNYQSEMDVLGRFFEECCVLSDKVHAGASDLYRVYKVWCTDNGETVQSQTWLGRRLSERVLTRENTRTGVIWRGIGIRAT